MAASDKAIDTSVIVEFGDLVANDPDDLDTNFDEIVSKYNASLETSTGHTHNKVDSPAAMMAGTNFTTEDFFKMSIMGGL